VQASALRKELRIEGVRMNIVKNAVARFAFEKLGLAELSKAMEGMNAIVYGEDAAVMAKKITEFVEKTKTLKIKGGLIEGRAVEAPAIRDLAQLPSKKDLQAMFVGTLASPASTFVGTLQSVLGTFVRTLAAVEEKLPKA
jgi:large subunit ribosomal protein L10